MPRLTDETVQAVREATRIEQVIDDYGIPLRRSGSSLLAFCPFHDERTPSFAVNPARGVWFCHGACAEGGDALTFVQKIDKMSFLEAVEHLADEFHIPLDYEEGANAARQRSERNHLLNACATAATYYAACLRSEEGQAARAVLLARGFDGDDAQQFDLGYAPRSGTALLRHLHEHGVTADTATAAGLARWHGNQLRDFFVGRLMLPIRNITGQIVGFGGRQVHEDDPVDAKYLNGPGTVIYQKNRLLYGLDHARREISRNKQAVVVEGYTDVMACRLAGITNAVATCGTAFGAEHLAVLRRLVGDDGEIIFTHDGDDAGLKASLRVYDLTREVVRRVTVARDPAGRDPCEVRQHDGDAALANLVRRRGPLLGTVLDTALTAAPRESPEDRVAALDTVAPLLGHATDPVIRAEYAKTVATALQLPLQVVADRVHAQPHPASGTAGHTDTAAGQTAGLPARAEQYAVRLLLQHPELVRAAAPALLDPNLYRSSTGQRLLEVLRPLLPGEHASGDTTWAQRVAAGAPEALQATLFRELTAPIPAADLPQHAREVLAMLQDACLEAQTGELTSALTGITDPDDRAERLERAARIQRERFQLRHLPA